MIRAIDDFPSFFTPRQSSPRIIDCGANIGISVLEWKTRWPMARILCFEPDPNAFRLLQRNIEANDIPNVRCIEAAVSDIDGRAELFGDLGKRADSRGNSLLPEWGERDGSSVVEVRCLRLSPYLNEPVAFLKLDIEGAEERVLRESSSQLHRVEAVYVEVHETDRLAGVNCGRRVKHLLESAGFFIESEPRFEAHALPPHLDDWRRREGAQQSQLLGWR